MKISLSDIRSNYQGFSRLVELEDSLEKISGEPIEIDMSKVNWLDANMCAPLGALLYKTSRNLNTVTITNVDRLVEAILSKNDFLTSYGRQKRADSFGTTIPYCRFEPDLNSTRLTPAPTT